MYQISEFSKRSSTPVKTLRYYDNIHILRPKTIGESNGYRYYSNDQLDRIRMIKELKNMGFSLKEISLLIDSYNKESLLKKKEELQKAIRNNTENVAVIDKLISKLKNKTAKFDEELIYILDKKERKMKNMKEKYLLAKEKLSSAHKFYKDNKFEECMLKLEELKVDIFESEKAGDPFWTNSAGDLFAGVAYEMFGNNDTISFLNIFKFEVDGKELIDNLEEYGKNMNKNSYPYLCFGSLTTSTAETRDFIVTIYKQILKTYAMFDIAN